jgi:uncharacterized protein (UPF0333 family)
MKKQLKLTAAALLLAVTASTSFAADFVTGINDIASVHTWAEAAMLLSVGANAAEQNIGLVSQVGDLNIAYIQQSTGTGSNFAAIIQDATSATVSNVGYVFQAGTGNRAVIYQH